MLSEQEIEQLLAEPDPLLANPPTIADRFRFTGDMSLSRALVHPTLGPALQNFHDRLVWSRGEPEIGAEGIELFRLNYAFVSAGHPIVSMPPARIAAGIIWDQTMRQLDPEYRRAVKGKLGPDLSPVLIANTIHGSRTLLRNCKIVQRQIVAAFRSRNVIEFSEYAEVAEATAVRAADRYDPNRGAKFSTYLHRRLKGAALDWRESQPMMVYLDQPIYRGELDARESLIDRLPDLWNSYFPGGQKSYLPVPSDHWLADTAVDFDVWRRRLDKIAAVANLTERQKIILWHLRNRDDGYTYLAQQLGITYDHLKVEISRLKKKLRAAVT